MGIDIGPYTLRELIRMVEVKQTERWDHTASVCATILNARQGVEKFTDPMDLNPYRKRVLKKGVSKMPHQSFDQIYGDQ